MRVWGAQAKRFKELAEKAGADVFLASHVNIDKTPDKVNAVKFRKPGGPHPLVNKAAVSRAQAVVYECMDAQLAWGVPQVVKADLVQLRFLGHSAECVIDVRQWSLLLITFLPIW